MNLFSLALRNLGRQKLRTALGILAISVGVLVVVLFKGFADGMIDTMLTSGIQLNSGHVRIIDDEYRLKERLLSLNYPVDGFAGEGFSQMLTAIDDVEGVEEAAGRLRFPLLVSVGEETESGMGIGVDPLRESRITQMSRFIQEGRWVEDGNKEVVVGYRLLDKLNLKVGDRVTLVFSTAYGSMRGHTVDIVGRIESGFALLDNRSIYLPLSLAQDMLDFGDAVTEIVVMTANEGRVPPLLAGLSTLLQDQGADETYTAIPWYNANEVVEYMHTAKIIYNVFYILIALLASFVVANTMVMIINERKREIGMLRALGLRRSQVLRLFMYEGLLIGFMGSLIGIFFGGGILAILSRVGISVPGMETIGEEFLMLPTVYPRFDVEVLLVAFLIGIFVTVFTVFWPARQAAGLKPTEALRTDT